MDRISSNFESLNKEEISQFAGKWIAIINNQVVINATSFKEVYNYVKKEFPNQKPLIGKIPESNPIVLNSIR